MKIYIVLHHEIMGSPDDYRADEMVFWTCSSIEKALVLIKGSGVDKWSWWEIQVQDLDDQEWPEHVGYYGLRGGKLRRQPYEKCIEIFKKEGRWQQTRMPSETIHETRGLESSRSVESLPKP